MGRIIIHRLWLEYADSGAANSKIIKGARDGNAFGDACMTAQ
jgi:hypothetical protein